ncbi:hypothetical protein BU24DRAFT_492988 [Aaosphaeria arxii CBS 175.79]|uniref:Wax synthase domain-containing protein n=1 Tax=Aaosphaeria arxii CBS 175.79 TaxID=1450172 RepID=A0A6A5XM74_9PLEO|nr:uncharacterized protein BU24DRAFT_492988 [Aaosphaeria arxii CBS 175.79]KAF2014335.1 hypothetical protein BU24DRAFT_492988 [Aaosphaeria arxii CBS 175.79]
MMTPSSMMLSVALMVSFQLTLTLPLLLLPENRPVRMVVIVLLVFQYVNLVNTSSGDAAMNWGLGLAITPQLLKGFEIYITHTPASEHFHRIRLRDEPVDGSNGSNGLSERLLWALELVYTPRGIGWNWEIPYVCYIGTESKSAYLASRIKRIALFSVMLFALSNGMPNSKSPSITGHPPLSIGLLVPTWAYAISAYLQLWLTFTIPATFMVGFGFGDPRAFPYMMGPIGAMASLRCFWGRTWHQAVRRQMTTAGNLLTSQAGITKGTIESAYLKLLVGFLISAWTHAVAGYKARGGGPDLDPTGAFRFFLLQFCGIVFEDLCFHILQLLRIIGADWRNDQMSQGKYGYGKGLEWWVLDKADMVLGYIWVILWFSITLPPYVEAIRMTGALD